MDVALADPARGKFRSFLLFALQNFLTNEWAPSTRQKRGGGCALVSWERESAEHRYGGEPADRLTPEKIVEKQWAITLLERVLGRVEQEQTAAERRPFFDQVKAWLWGDKPPVGYAGQAEQLGMSEAALKVAVHRLRVRYRELLREEIGRTVRTPLEVQQELDDLLHDRTSDVKLLAVADGRELASLDTGKPLCFSPDGRLLATASLRQPTGQELRVSQS